MLVWFKMRNFITQNQKALAYLAEKHKVKIDFEAGAIFDYLKGMILSQSPKIVKNRKDINGLTYTKVYYSKIFKDMPLLSMKDSRGIKKRIETGVEVGLFKKHIIKEDGNTLYYSITELGYEVLENSLTDTKEIDEISRSDNMTTKQTVRSEEIPHQPQQSSTKRTSDNNFRRFLYELKNALPNKYKLKIKDISINSKNDSLEAIENNDIAYNSWIKLSKKYSTKEIIETFVKYTEVEEKNSNGRYVKNIVNFLINYDEVKKREDEPSNTGSFTGVNQDDYSLDEEF